ncbi:MAG: ABC transporter ATP-binding protein [Proteobacteria bacterium]|nr:ABC transporter ATP-binding protein [Pseudomonadota bacterium]
MTSVNGQSLLEVRGLEVTFETSGGTLRAVDGVSYDIAPGRTLGVVGESGGGKSMTALAILRLVPAQGSITGGRVALDGVELTGLDEAGMEAVRGDRIAMIFQEPMTSLNPVLTIGEQIAEVYLIHRKATRKEALGEAVELLAKVRIPDPAARAMDYPHRLSGGMRQRAMIAMALACRPALLIADEPTTALDVTIQAQILELMLEIQDEMGMAIQFISHNLGVISEVADEVAVMYAGRIVERASTRAIFDQPLHPYTKGLIETVPVIGKRQRRLPAIPGVVPDLMHLPSGCRFSDRCALADKACREAEPELTDWGGGHFAACFKAGQ